MTRPRRSRRRYQSLSTSSGHCPDWPCCSCGEKRAFYNEAFFDRIDREPLDDEELEDVRLSIFTMLCCCSAHCPDKAVRQHALSQLMQPIFAGIEGRGRWLD